MEYCKGKCVTNNTNHHVLYSFIIYNILFIFNYIGIVLLKKKKKHLSLYVLFELDLG